MALAHCVFDATNENTGALLSNVLVEVRLESSGALVACYSDRDGTISLGTSFTVSDGRVSFFAVGGAYKITLTAPGHSRILRYVANGTSAETDVGVVNFAGYTYTFETGTSAPPSAASIRADGADLTAATEFYIDDDTLAGNDISAILLALGPASGNTKNQIRLTDPANGAQLTADITGVTDNTDYVTLAVSGNVGATSMSAGSVKLDFILAGAKGVDGVDANEPGIRYTFSTTTTDSDPGTGVLRINHATIANATGAYLDNADADGADVTGDLDTWDDSTNTIKGEIVIRSADTPTTYAKFQITGSVVDGTGYRKLTLTYLAGTGTLADAENISVQFSRAGDNGVAGGGMPGLVLRAGSITNIDLSTALENGDSAGGVTLATGDVFGAFGQSTASQNGIYVVQATGAAVRHADFNAYDENCGAVFTILEGTLAGDWYWCTSANGGTIDSANLVFAEFTSGGGAASSDESPVLLIEAARAKDSALYGIGFDRFADAFEALDFVDVAGATNLSTSESGLLQPSSTSSAAVGPSAGSGGGGYNSSSGTDSGNGKKSDGYGGGSGAGAGAVSNAGVGAAGSAGLIVVTYTPSGGSEKIIVLTSGSTWEVPADWDNDSFSIEAIGPSGGSGNGSNDGSGGRGGGGSAGGAYAKVTDADLSLTAEATVNISIPTGGAIATAASGDTWLNKTTASAPSVVTDGLMAKAGPNGTSAVTTTPGTGGAAPAASASVGTVKYAGGDGGGGGVPGAGAGGGAAGPNGEGKNGAAGSGSNGGGGGGANNGSAASGQTGGNGRGATGGGAGGQPGVDGTDGTGGGGGGATGGAGSVANLTGGAGSQDDVWTPTAVVNSLSVNTQSIAAASAPSTLKAYIYAFVTGSPTINTDFGAKFRRTSSGALEDATLTLLGTQPDGANVYVTDEVNVSGLTSGAVPTLNLWTDNEAVVKFDAHQIEWG